MSGTSLEGQMAWLGSYVSGLTNFTLSSGFSVLLHVIQGLSPWSLQQDNWNSNMADQDAQECKTEAVRTTTGRVFLPPRSFIG